MGDNIFLKEMKEIQFEDYFKYDAKCRGNLGDELPVMVYRMLEYSLKDELKNRFGKEVQIEVFRSAGRKAGEYFAKNMLNLDVPLDQFVNELQKKMQELKIGRVYRHFKGDHYLVEAVAKDSETGESAWINTSSKRTRAEYSRWFGAVNEGERRLFNRYQIDSVDIATDQDYVKGLMTFFGRR